MTFRICTLTRNFIRLCGASNRVLILYLEVLAKSDFTPKEKYKYCMDQPVESTLFSISYQHQNECVSVVLLFSLGNTYPTVHLNITLSNQAKLLSASFTTTLINSPNLDIYLPATRYKMSTTSSPNVDKSSAIYRVSNVTLDLVTLGVFTGRYRRGWPNAWTSDGCSCPTVNTDGTHKPYCTAGVAQRQKQHEQK